MALKTKFFNTPILLITFNRPWLTQQVFDQIRKARPTKLYISNDGPRSDRKGEYEKCVQVRDIIKQVDWKCIVKTRFSEINQGCKYGPVNAINWFFESEEMGIILEDDCIPHPDFFRFCEELLIRYKDNTQVALINGTNLLGKWKNNKKSYHFSCFLLFGWATWRRTWIKYDVNFSGWENEHNQKLIKEYYNQNNFSYKMLEQGYILTEIEKYQSWDYQMEYYMALNRSYSIIPSVNLIKNIGFGDDSTHTQNKSTIYRKNELNEMVFPLIYNDDIILDIAFINKLEKFYKGTLYSRFIRLLKKLIKEIIKWEDYHFNKTL